MTTQGASGEHRKAQLWGAVIAVVLGLAALLVVAVSSSSGAKAAVVFGLGALVALAFAGMGALLGFLFGVPKSREADPKRSYTPNTNIEDISDWLTKILIGATLVQLGELSNWLGDLFDGLGEEISPKLGAGYPGTTAVYFFVVGFFGGWFVTAVYVPQTLTWAGRKLAEIEDQIEAALRQGDPDEVERLRLEAAGLKKGVEPVSDRYADLRSSAPAGPARTFAMEQLAREARMAAANDEVNLDRDSVREKYEEGVGGRIEALGFMQGRPSDLALPDKIVNSITESLSAFEQYQALYAASAALDQFEGADRNQLKKTIEQQMAPGGFIVRGSDRYPLAQGILDRM